MQISPSSTRPLYFFGLHSTAILLRLPDKDRPSYCGKLEIPLSPGLSTTRGRVNQVFTDFPPSHIKGSFLSFPPAIYSNR